VVSIEGRDVPTWEALNMAILPKAGREVDIIVLRDGVRQRFEVTPIGQTKYEVGDIGIQPLVHPQIAAVTSGEPADKAGLRKGDVILAVDGLTNVQNDDLVRHIRSRDGQMVRLTIRRDGTVQQIAVTPRNKRIGVQLSPFEVRTIEPGPFQAVVMSFERNWEWTKLIFRTLVGLFTRETSVKQLMGPVGIAELSGGAAQLGWIPLFNLMAMISLNLGLLNLMPIPVLDGGHIAIMALEGVARRDFSVRVKERLLIAGFVVLMALMVTVIYNDLTRVQWLERLMPWR
jgi:regulator of sigma E protease